jgi:undecaprenyl-diphosphatase
LDYTIYKAINGLSGGAFADDVFKFLANSLPGILIALVALAFLIPWRSHLRERRAGAVFATVSAALALLINQPIAHLVDRTRPYLAHPAHSHLLISRSHDPSFPSDHATGAFALGFAIWLYDRTIGAVLLVLAALLAFSRVYVGTHYPGDVVAGALIGIGVAAALYLISPTRRFIEAFASWCAAIWDRVLLRLLRARGEGGTTSRPT